METIGSYLIGRCFIRNLSDFNLMIKTTVVLLALILPFAIYESLSQQPLLLRLFSALGDSHPNVPHEIRWGLDRAQASFEHPILYGVFAGSLFALVTFSSKHKVAAFWAISTFIVFVSSMLSLSSGAILLIAVQLGLILWSQFFKGINGRWTILTIIIIITYIIIDIISTASPFHVFVNYLTFNSTNSYNRILIWHYGTMEVMRHPILGIGLSDWSRPYWMSASMDNFWLVHAVRYGLPGFLLIAGAVLLHIRSLSQRRRLSRELANARLGVVITIVGVSVAICSVHLWNASYAWFLFLLGSSAWLANCGTRNEAAKRLTTDQK